MKETQITARVGHGHISLLETRAEGTSYGTVLVVPPFAMHARSLFAVALALSQSGFRVLRLDGRDSLGKGSGSIFDFKMTTWQADLEHALEVAARGEPAEGPVIVAGFSLAARPIVRALTGRSCGGMVLVTPVFHLRSTLAAVIGEDLFATADDELPESLRVLGQPVGRDFIRDARAHRFDDLATTLDELSHVHTPAVLICGDEDPWAVVDDVRAGAAAMRTGVKVITLEASSHELNRNPRVAMNYVAELTLQCLTLAGQPASRARVPGFAEVIEELGRTRLENEVARITNGVEEAR